MNNDRGQSPCLVAAYAQGACNGGRESQICMVVGYLPTSYPLQNFPSIRYLRYVVAMFCSNPY